MQITVSRGGAWQRTRTYFGAGYPALRTESRGARDVRRRSNSTPPHIQHRHKVTRKVWLGAWLRTRLARVNHTGRTSMEIGIKVVTEHPTSRVCRHAMTCYFTMVAVDDDGRPTPVLPLTPDSPLAQQRFDAAARRRELRRGDA